MGGESGYSSGESFAEGSIMLQMLGLVWARVLFEDRGPLPNLHGL